MICALTAGLSESMRLKTRERELAVLEDALASLKSAAAYTAGDLYALLSLCSENAFLRLVRRDGALLPAWEQAAQRFFTYRADRELASAFIRGYGKTDLEGQLAYITLFETRTQAALRDAKANSASKCKLYVALGMFSGTAAALILI